MPMAACNQIIGYLDELLDPTAYDDYGPNGLQVPGSEQIQTVVTGVSAERRALRARARGGRRPRPRPPRAVLGPGRRGALDRRLEAPPAAALRRRHRASPPTTCRSTATSRSATTRCSPGRSAPARSSRSRPTGARPSASARASPATASRRRARRARARALTGREPLAFTDGPDPVRTIGIVSGAGADHLEDAIAAGLDAFVTGEPAERSMARAREAGVHFLAAGHYATETFGVRRAGRARWPSASASATSSSTSPTRSRARRLPVRPLRAPFRRLS